MNGFIIKISINNINFSNTHFIWKQPFDFQGLYFKRCCEGLNYQIEQFTSQKFKNHKNWIETTDFLFLTEGIILNLTDLCKNNQVTDVENLILKYHKEKKYNFFSEFEGNFVGIFHDKNTNTWTAFNNKTGMKKLFYFQNSDFVIFGTDLKSITECLKSLKIRFSLCEEAAYLLLTSGFMQENLTLINEVKQLRAGEFCNFKDANLYVDSYFNLKNIAETIDSKDDIIIKLNDLFINAVRLEFEFDKTNNYRHLTTLSGGLDSRMTALIAHKMGYKNQILLNFSEKGYADEIIAKQIAKDFNIELIQTEISAQSLAAIDEVVSVNDGLILYSGCSHVFSILNNLMSEKDCILHTGMIGDAVMGSFVSLISEVKPHILDGLNSRTLLNKSEDFLIKSMKNYPTEELYKFYNRAFLGANSGFQYFDLIGESTSPFLNSEFMSYAYSIPRKYKYKEKIYIDWIKTLHPDIANYTWESIGGKPTNNKLSRNLYKYKRAIIKRLPIKTMWKNTMSPEQLWYDKNIDVKNKLDIYYAKNINLLFEYLELKEDLIKLYETGNITEKTQVLTLLSAYKLLFV